MPTRKHRSRSQGGLLGEYKNMIANHDPHEGCHVLDMMSWVLDLSIVLPCYTRMTMFLHTGALDLSQATVAAGTTSTTPPTAARGPFSLHIPAPATPGPLTTSYTGYDAYGNAVASVDALAQANPGLYSERGRL